MRVTAASVVVGLMLGLGVASAGAGEPLPQVGPPFTEVAAAWESFWAAVRRGDLEAARRYVHSRIRHDFPRSGTTAGKDLQDVARQMAYCRLDPTPIPISGEEVVYGLRCRHGTETAESQVILRRDVDGVWRFTSL
jgi:hypothetical protein